MTARCMTSGIQKSWPEEEVKTEQNTSSRERREGGGDVEQTCSDSGVKEASKKKLLARQRATERTDLSEWKWI